MTIAAKARPGKSWLRSVPLLVLVAFVSRSLAQDIYFVPAGFPAVCAQNLVTGVDHCPDGTGPSADKFCEADLPMLKAFVRQERLAVCGGATATSAGSYDQILLIDMRGASETLRHLLGPFSQKELRVSHGGLFRDQRQIDRTVHLAFEMRVDQDSGTGSTQPPNSDSSPALTDLDPEPEATTSTSDTPSGNSTSNMPAGDTTSEASGGDSGARPTGGPARVQRRINVQFDRNFLRFRSNFARGLSRWTTAGRAAELSVVPEIRDVHNDLLSQVFCKTCSRNVDYIEADGGLNFEVVFYYQQEPVRRVQGIEIIWK